MIPPTPSNERETFPDPACRVPQDLANKQKGVGGVILSDKQIWKRIRLYSLIEIPKHYKSLNILEEQTPISRGVTSAGYDLTLGEHFGKFNGIGVVDPLDFRKEDVLDGGDVCIHPDDHIVIPGGGFVLAHSVEVVNMSTDLVATAVGKSTYARCGLIVNVTPIEPGFRGQITLELHNASPNPVKVYLFQGICQLQFHQIEEPEKHYGNKNEGEPGKYQSQFGITFPKGERYQ